MINIHYLIIKYLYYLMENFRRIYYETNFQDKLYGFLLCNIYGIYCFTAFIFGILFNKP